MPSKKKRQGKAQLQKLSESSSMQNTNLATPESKLHPGLNENQKAALQASRKFLLFIDLYVSLCDELSDSEGALNVSVTSSTFDNALQRPLLTDQQRAHFESSKAMAQTIFRDLIHQDLPSRVAERADSDADTLLEPLLRMLLDDDNLC